VELSRDIKWLKLCIDASKIFSTCGKRQYASYIVDEHGYQIGFGYNGVPRGMAHCVDNGCPRLAEGSTSGSDYSNCRSIHAESNALLHSDYIARRQGCTLYVNGPPCWWCGKLIANSGVTKLVYIRDSSYVGFDETMLFLIEAGIAIFGYDKEDVMNYVEINSGY
jgi:dCMP deaminase